MDNDNIAKIGELISRLRKSKGMTQKDLAERLGVTDKAVSKWERGQSYPDISLIIPLSDLLGVTANELLSGEVDNDYSEDIETDEKSVNADIEEKSHESDEAPLPAEKSNIDQDRHNREEKSGEGTAYKVLSDERNIEADITKNTAAKRLNGSEIRNIILISFLGSVLIAIVVCMICDLAINDRLRWSPTVIISCIAGWIVALPIIKARRRVVMKILIVLTIITVPYLYLLFRTTYIWNIFAMGSPIYFVSIIGLWCIYATFLLLRNKKLYALGSSFIIAAPVTILINNITEYFTALHGWSNIINDFREALVEVNPMDDVVNMIFMLILAAACFCTGYFLYHREKRK